jgi:hypothetical protein
MQLEKEHEEQELRYRNKLHSRNKRSLMWMRE